MFTLNTSADTRYFSRVLNLIGSVRDKASVPVAIRVWDIGLTRLQRRLLALARVEIAAVPPFSPHWRHCYTWKVYVLRHAPEPLFLHLDAGNTVRCDIKLMFDQLAERGTLLVDQGQSLAEICPPDYFARFYPAGDPQDHVFAAGNIGFSRTYPGVGPALDEAYACALDGMCLGFSPREAFRDTAGLNIVRQCHTFRHDQSLLNMCFRKHLAALEIFPHLQYAAVAPDETTRVFNQRRRSYRWLHRCVPVWAFPALLAYCLTIDVLEVIRTRIALRTAPRASNAGPGAPP